MLMGFVSTILSQELVIKYLGTGPAKIPAEAPIAKADLERLAVNLKKKEATASRRITFTEKRQAKSQISTPHLVWENLYKNREKLMNQSRANDKNQKARKARANKNLFT